MIDYKELSNELINGMLQVLGLWETIQFLLNSHITKEQLVEELDFNADDVEKVIKTYE